MLGLLAGFNWFNKPRFMGAQASRREVAADRLQRKRYLWFACPGRFCAGRGALGLKGLNLGIDFKAEAVTFKTPAANTTGDVRQVGDAGYADAVIRAAVGDERRQYKSFRSDEGTEHES